MTLFEAAKTVSALDVAERYAGVKTVKKGRHAWAHCPFHGDENPSLAFDLEGKYAGRFKCWSCNRFGSSVEFVAEWYHEKPADAAKRICADYGIEFENASADVREKAKKKRAVDHLTSEIREAQAFAFCVANGVIREAQDKLDQLVESDPLFISDTCALNAIIEDAKAFKEALQTPKDLKTAYALLTQEGTKEKLEGQYRRLKMLDEHNGTDYVSGYNRGTL